MKYKINYTIDIKGGNKNEIEKYFVSEDTKNKLIDL